MPVTSARKNDDFVINYQRRSGKSIYRKPALVFGDNVPAPDRLLYLAADVMGQGRIVVGHAAVEEGGKRTKHPVASFDQGNRGRKRIRERFDRG